MLTRRSFLAATAVIPAAGLIATPALAAKPSVYATDGIAINGYDPVAYFTMSKPVSGDMAHASDWEGVKMLFSSAENKAMFDADPEKFAPKYGGYCAYAVSKGGTATTSPDAWTVYEDRLYLNFNTTVRGIWDQDKPGNIAKADANWPGVLA